MYALKPQFIGFVDVFLSQNAFFVISLLIHVTKSFFGKVSFTCLFNDVRITECFGLMCAQSDSFLVISSKNEVGRFC